MRAYTLECVRMHSPAGEFVEAVRAVHASRRSCIKWHWLNTECGKYSWTCSTLEAVRVATIANGEHRSSYHKVVRLQNINIYSIVVRSCVRVIRLIGEYWRIYDNVSRAFKANKIHPSPAMTNATDSDVTGSTQREAPTRFHVTKGSRRVSDVRSYTRRQNVCDTLVSMNFETRSLSNRRARTERFIRTQLSHWMPSAFRNSILNTVVDGATSRCTRCVLM